MRTRLLTLMALISAGCDREQPCTTGANSVKYCILMVRQGEGGPTNWSVEASRRCREIELTTNATERLAMLQRSADNVLATPLDDLEHDRQDRLFAFIPDRNSCRAEGLMVRPKWWRKMSLRSIMADWRSLSA